MTRIARIVFATLFAIAILIMGTGVWLFVSNARQDLRVALVRDPSEPGTFTEIITSSNGALCVQGQVERVWNYGLVFVSGQSMVDDIVGECRLTASAQPQALRLDLRHMFSAQMLAHGHVCVEINYHHVGQSDTYVKLACE